MYLVHFVLSIMISHMCKYDVKIFMEGQWMNTVSIGIKVK